jgi:hypothetical protein
MFRYPILIMRRYVSLALAVFAIFLFLNTAFAYHHLYILTPTPVVVKWRSLPVNFTVDKSSGAAGTDILAEMQEAATTWNNVSTAQNVFGSLTLTSTDLTGANFGTDWGILSGDGKHEVVLDEDGSAFAELGLDPAGVNGVAFNQQSFTSGQGAITDAFLVINGVRTNFDRRSTEVHEFGHIQGLDHSAVGMHNSASFQSEALDVISVNSVPTMHPSSIAGAARRTLEPDDIASLSELYPESTFSSTLGSIEGTVTRCGGSDAVTGANVRAVNTANTSIQLGRFSGFDGNNTGRFVINGLPPGDYRLVIEPFGANNFTLSGFGPPPATADIDFSSEYHNPPGEDDCSEEVPDTAVTISASGGAVASNKNFKVGGADLAFVIDDTGSMGPEIGAVRTVLSGFVSVMNFITSTTGRSFPTVSIVTFKDNVAHRVMSNDPARLQSIIGGLVASGGGDCPEHANDALLAAGRVLKKRGVAILFTDADSHPSGADRNSVTTLYRSKGLTLTTLLSGTCTGALEPVSTFSSSGSEAAEVCNGLFCGNSSNFEEFPLPKTLGFENAVRTFSEISLETGGYFITIPKASLFDPVQLQNYINTGTNLAVSSVVPAVGVITPDGAPRGSSLTLEVKGSNTNFLSSSSVSFSGDGITVNSTIVNSPESITVNISIHPDAALGFRDVTVTTALGEGKTETATGTGAFHIEVASSIATVIGVTPAIGSQGQTLNVTISGVNTNFANGVSVANFGAGIVVNSTNVTGSTSAIANITIADNAAIGFRDVRVTTGVEIAAESDVGPFIVTAPPPPIPRVTLAEPDNGSRGQTLDITITGQNTHFIGGTSVVSFSGTGITVNNTNVTSQTTAVANITIASDATLGFRDVLITTGDEIAVGLLAFQVGEADGSAAQIDALIAFVLGLDISPGIKKALLSELNAAVAAIESHQGACGNLKSFQNLVSAQTGKTISPIQAEQMTVSAQQIRDFLSCK